MKKMSIQEVKTFVENGYNIQQTAKQMCIALLGDTNEFTSPLIEFDWKNGDAPSFACGCFDDDITDAYVTSLYLDKGLLKADLHAYYIGRDAEDVDLGNELNVDYLEILEYINSHRDEPVDEKPRHLFVNTDFGEVMLKPSQDNKGYVDVFSGDNYDNYLGMFLGSLNDDIDELTQNATSVFSDFND